MYIYYNSCMHKLVSHYGYIVLICSKHFSKLYVHTIASFVGATYVAVSVANGIAF